MSIRFAASVCQLFAVMSVPRSARMTRLGSCWVNVGFGRRGGRPGALGRGGHVTPFLCVPARAVAARVGPLVSVIGGVSARRTEGSRVTEASRCLVVLGARVVPGVRGSGSPIVSGRLCAGRGIVCDYTFNCHRWPQKRKWSGSSSVRNIGH